MDKPIEIADGTIDEKIRAWQDLIDRLERDKSKLDYELAEQQAGYRLPYTTSFWPRIFIFFVPVLIFFVVLVISGDLRGRKLVWGSLLLVLVLWTNISSGPAVRRYLLNSKPSREKLMVRMQELESALVRARDGCQFWKNEKTKHSESSRPSDTVVIPTFFPSETTSVPHWVDPSKFRGAKYFARKIGLFLLACFVLWLLNHGIDGLVETVLNK